MSDLSADDTAERLDPPRPVGPSSCGRLNVLCLSGGGYRGLFTAGVLEGLEADLLAQHGVPLASCFDLFCGTSIGGLLAAGLAAGVSAAELRRSIAGAAPAVFRPRRLMPLRRLFGRLYDAGALKEAVAGTLGGAAGRRMDELPVPLLLPVVSWVRGSGVLLRSAGLGRARASPITLADACLATAAAPTYFPAHEAAGDTWLDGGLVANAPDVYALLEAQRRWPERAGGLQMLSIGTAGVPAGRMGGSAPRGALRWALPITPFVLEAQERLAVAAAADTLGARYLRLDQVPAPGQARLADLAAVDARMTATLEAMAAATLQRVRAEGRAALDRFAAGAGAREAAPGPAGEPLAAGWAEAPP